jgi:Peptidase of plants and bacteria
VRAPKWLLLLSLSLSFGSAGTLRSQTAPSSPMPVFATVVSTLHTAGGHIRQFAFDGDASSYFASRENPGPTDHFTLAFDKPVALKTIKVVTGIAGKTENADALDSGLLEVSSDGKTFKKLEKFSGGTAAANLSDEMLLAIRIKPDLALTHPLAIREFTVESNPAVITFKYPVEFILDTTDAPEMREWGEKVIGICERQYYMINEELRSDGFKPRNVVNMRLSSNYNGVAATGGGRIQGSVKYFKAHPDDIGAMVHETVHVVQSYRRSNNPGWLVEGIADYVRFVKYEPGKLRRLTPERARYNGSYQTTAAFLDFVAKKYDKDLVRKLNAAMREGRYKEELFKEFSGKTLPELGEEWKVSLRR